jgi:hypothetical protein
MNNKNIFSRIVNVMSLVFMIVLLRYIINVADDMGGKWYDGFTTLAGWIIYMIIIVVIVISISGIIFVYPKSLIMRVCFAIFALVSLACMLFLTAGLINVIFGHPRPNSVPHRPSDAFIGIVGSLTSLFAIMSALYYAFYPGGVGIVKMSRLKKLVVVLFLLGGQPEKVSRVLAVLVLVLTLGWWFRPTTTPISFDGTSDALKQTDIVPALDSTITPGRNIIWCASFLAAWKSLQNYVAQEPLVVEGAQELCDSLNNAAEPKDYIPENALCAMAGRVADGIIPAIHKALETKFPSKTLPSFSGNPPDSIIAYAYLEAVIKFAIPYLQNDEPLIFTDSSGKTTPIKSFGFHEFDPNDNALKDQPEVIFASDRGEELIVDLDRQSAPSQIIIANIQPEKTLFDTIMKINKRIDEYRSAGKEKINLRTFLIPDIFWRVSHRFNALEGKSFKNNKIMGQPIATAQQDILFRLNRSGAELFSESFTASLSEAIHFVVDKPFLLYMKKRGAELPYFIMWVDNAELLQRQ